MLEISQPAVSARIKDLERKLGLSLTERAGGSIAITIAGRAIYESALAILRQADALQTMTGSLQEHS